MNKSVLVIDDDVDFAKIIAQRIMSFGYHVTSAQDAAQATAKAVNEVPDAIILDLGLPAGGGKAVLENLSRRVETSLIPVIVVSGQEEAKVQQVISGFHSVKSVFSKPYSPQKLGMVLARIFENDL